MVQNSNKNKKNRKGLRILLALLCLVPLFAVFYISSIADQTENDTVVETWDSAAASGAGAELGEGDNEVTPVLNPDNPEDVSLPVGENLPEESAEPAETAEPVAEGEPVETQEPAVTVPPVDEEVPDEPAGDDGENTGKNHKSSAGGPAVLALGASPVEGEQVIEEGDVVLPSDFSDKTVMVDGFVLGNPTISDSSNLEESNRAKFNQSVNRGYIEYQLIQSGEVKYSVKPGQGRFIGAGTYDVSLVVIDASLMDTCWLGSKETNTLATGKKLTVSYATPGSTERFDKITTTTTDPKTGSTGWFKSASVAPKEGYHFLVENTAGNLEIKDDPITYKHNTPLGTVIMARDEASGKPVLQPFILTEQKYNIDSLTPKESRITGYTGYGDYPRFVTNKSTNSIPVVYSIKDQDPLGDSGKSQGALIEYKITNKSIGKTEITLEDYNSVPLAQGMKSGAKSITGDGTVTINASLSGFSDGDRVYIYSKVTDKAGNVYCFFDNFGYIDYSGPALSSDNEKINAKIANMKDNTSVDLHLLMFTADFYGIKIRDRNLTKVTVGTEEYGVDDFSEDDEGYRIFEVELERPGEPGYSDSFTLKAEDGSGHTKTLNIECLNCLLTPDTETIDLGERSYGYAPFSGVGNIFTLSCAYNSSLNLANAISSIKLTDEDGKETDVFSCVTSVIDGTEPNEKILRYSVVPKENLDCRPEEAPYKALLTVTYDLQKATTESSYLLLGDGYASGGVSKEVTFTVKRLPIRMQYKNGRSTHSTTTGSNEFYQKQLSASDWAERLSVKSGLINGQTDKTVYTDRNYKKPNIIKVIPATSDVLEDGRVIGDGVLYFEIAEGPASTNYYYEATKAGTESDVVGEVTCVRDSFGRSEGEDIRSYSLRGTTGRPNWYTSEVTIASEKGFKIMNAGTIPCQYDFSTGQVVTIGSTVGYLRKYDPDLLSEKPIVVSKDSTGGTGVVQYFYQYDEKQGIVSDLMSEIILIDRSSPGFTWGKSGETAIEGLPYFRFLEKVGDVVLAAVSSGLPATKSDPLTLHNLQDPESGVLSAQYLILSQAGLKKAQLEGQSGWRDLLKSGANYYLSGGIPEDGYLYVKITNYAGLSIYLSMDDQLDFSGEEKKDQIEMNPVIIPAQIYGYEDVKPQLVDYTGTSKTGQPIYIVDARVDDGPGGGSEYFSVRSMGETGKWYITPTTGLEVGKYNGILKAQFSNGEVRTAKIYFEVTRKELVATYHLSKTSYYLGEYIIDDGKLEVTGFIPGEGRTASADGLTVKAAGYEDPVCVVPSVATDSMWVGPKDGHAKNYSFIYSGSMLTVNKRTPVAGTHYTVTPARPASGWYTTDVTIVGGNGGENDRRRYRLSLKPDGSEPLEKITLTDETKNGSVTFYILDTSTGEILGPVVFAYKIDKHPPVISGAKDGETYTENARQILVTDDNLKSVTVNGQAQVVSSGRSVFTVHPSSATQRFDITATDESGQVATLTFVMTQPSVLDPTPAPTEKPGGSGGDPVPTAGPGGSSQGGTVVSSVQAENGAPIVRVSSDDEEVKNAVLDKSELTAVNDGSNLSLRIVVRDISGEVSQSDKERAFQVLNGYTIGEYLSITVWKRIGSGEETQVLRTNSPLSLTISVPSDLRTDNADRRFAMLRLAPDATDMLKDKDSVPKKVTIYTDEFDAVYVLAYMDMPKSSSKTDKDKDEKEKPDPIHPKNKTETSPELGSSEQPEAGDRAPVIPTAIAFGLSFIGMITVVLIRRNSRYEWVWVEVDEDEDL